MNVNYAIGFFPRGIRDQKMHLFFRKLLCPSVFIFSLFIPESCIISSQNVSYCIKQCYL